MLPHSFVQQGQELVERGQFQEAVKVCRLGLLANPTAVEGRLVLATALLALRRYDEVLAEMRVALEVDGAHPRALALKGEALLRKGDAFQAAQVLHRARLYTPSDRRVAELCREAEKALAAADPGDFVSEMTDSHTKHYPAHRGMEEPGRMRAGSATSHVTWLSGASSPSPSGASRMPRPESPSPDDLSVGDHSGTMDLTGVLTDAYDVVDELRDDPLAEPPLPLSPARGASAGRLPGKEPTSQPRQGMGRGADVQDFSNGHDELDAVRTGVFQDETSAYRKPRRDVAAAEDSLDDLDDSSLDTDFEDAIGDDFAEEAATRARMIVPAARGGVPEYEGEDSSTVPGRRIARKDGLARPASPPGTAGLYGAARKLAREMGGPPPSTAPRPEPPPRRAAEPVPPQRPRPPAPRYEPPSTRAPDAPPPVPPLPPAPRNEPRPGPGRMDASAHRRRPEPEPGLSRGAPAVPLVAPPTAPPMASPMAPQRPPQSPPQRPLADIDALFPDDETGVSSVLPGPPPGASPALPAAPPSSRNASPMSLVADVVRDVRTPYQATVMDTLGRTPAQPSKKADMQLIRAGLGLDPEGSGEVDRQKFQQAAAAPRFDSAPPASFPSDALLIAPTRGPTNPADSTAAVPLQQASMPQRRSRWPLVLYIVLALAVVAGGVFAGFQIREIRLAGQIRDAERDAATYAGADTYDGYVRARAAYQNIVSVRATAATRAQLARAQAALAFEFGDGLDEARKLVSSLGMTDDADKNAAQSAIDNVDAAVARALLALAEGDVREAVARAQEVESKYPDEPSAGYLTGHAALLGGLPDEAIQAFRRAADRAPRPSIYVGLGHAYLSKSAFSEAKAAFERATALVPGHPAAVLGRARLVVASRSLTKEPDPVEAALEALIAEAPADASRVAPRQRALAALALAELALVRGDRAAALEAVARSRASGSPNDWKVSQALIELLVAADDMDAARAEAERAAKLWPERPEGRMILAEDARRRGNLEEAVKLLSGDLGASAAALTVRGRVYLAAGSLEEAIADLEKALAVQPGRLESVIARAEAELYKGDARSALARLEPLYSEQAMPSLTVVYAWALRESGKLDEARQILSRLVKLPEPGRAQLELARLEKQTADYQAARKAYDKAVAQLGGAPEARLEAALLALDTGDVKSARKTLDTLVKEVAGNAFVLAKAARVQILTGAFDLAEKNLGIADQMTAKPAWLLARERGRLALARGKPAEAVTSLARARDLEPNDPQTPMLLIRALLRADEGEQARKIMEDVLKQFPQSSPVRDLVRGVVTMEIPVELNRMDEARSAFTKALERLEAQKATPREIAEAYFWLGKLELYEGKQQAARKATDKALERDRGNVDAWELRGLLELERQDWKAAVNAYEQCVDIDPTGHPDSWFNLGVAYYNEGQTEQAKKAYERYLELQPNGELAEDARVNLDLLR